MNDKEYQEAKEHLEECEAAYASIGSAGAFVMQVVLRPLRDRLNEGERSRDLYESIMEVVI